MKKWCIRIANRITSFFHRFLWKRQMNIIKKDYASRAIDRLKTNLKYLILLPHADDEWVGCSTLISDPSFNVVLCNMNMSGNNDLFMRKKRELELLSLADVYKRSVLNCYDNLEVIIQAENPDCVVVPFFFDWHEDHFKVMDCLFRVIKDNLSFKFSILMYQVSVPIPEKEINYFMPMTKKEWRNKWKIFEKYYPSQVIIPYRRFAYNEMINGFLTNSYAGEVFVGTTIDKWKSDYFLLKPNKSEKSELKKSLNDLRGVRIYSNRMLQNKRG